MTNVPEAFVPGKAKLLDLVIWNEMILLPCRMCAAFCTLILGYALGADRAAKPPPDFDAHDSER